MNPFALGLPLDRRGPEYLRSDLVPPPRYAARWPSRDDFLATEGCLIAAYRRPMHISPPAQLAVFQKPRGGKQNGSIVPGIVLLGDEPNTRTGSTVEQSA